MRSKTIQVFLALSLAATMSACNTAPEEGGESGETVVPEATTPAEGGEGGEGAETTSPSTESEGGEGGEGGEGS